MEPFVGLARLRADAVGGGRRDPVDPEALRVADGILEDLRQRGEAALREHAERLGEIGPGEAWFLTRGDLEQAARRISDRDREVLERTRARIEAFAKAQMASLLEMEVPIPGGRAGHRVIPVRRAGCYAPGGRFPLPSSVLMTVVPARVAGVREVVVASPRPGDLTLAAAFLAGADALIRVGGAQAIGAMAFGMGPLAPCDLLVGPGNRYVTAAKHRVAGRVGIDMLAGPSELVVLADETADPAVVAADLLAQAEHDPDALPVVVTMAGPDWLDRLDQAIGQALQDLPTRPVAERALARGFAVQATSLEEACATCDRLAPEHLEVMVADLPAAAARLSDFGALFLGPRAAEIFGDYGAGPNHVLPTGGTARFTGGLSVMTFLRVHTWMELDQPEALIDDTARLARMEGLEAHARAAEARRRTPGG